MQHQIQVDEADWRSKHETSLIVWIRLAVVISLILAMLVEPSVEKENWRIGLLVLIGYFLFSFFVSIEPAVSSLTTQKKMMHWLDLLWITFFLFSLQNVFSVFSLGLIFVILTASFRWGLTEGIKTSIASSVVVLTCGTIYMQSGELPYLLLSGVLVLVFGIISAYWGESTLNLARRLSMLIEVSRISNPRFGIDQTITLLMQKLRVFYDGDACFMLIRDEEGARCWIRSIQRSEVPPSLKASNISAKLVTPLLNVEKKFIVIVGRSFAKVFCNFGSRRTYDSINKKWYREPNNPNNASFDLLANTYHMSVPLFLRKGGGRLYVTSRNRAFTNEDALFLSQICVQTVPVIENIELLDKIASNSAVRERQKIALDLHDATIQPYIGLKLGLSALRNKAKEDNPLLDGLDQIIAMSDQVITGLRYYARTFEFGALQTNQILQDVLQRYVQQFYDFYAINISIRLSDEININDRLAAEVLHIVREGLSNIRKHTKAKSGEIRLACENSYLKIDIHNEADGSLYAAFTPNSIQQRVLALGGTCCVIQGSDSGVTIFIEIPL